MLVLIWCLPTRLYELGVDKIESGRTGDRRRVCLVFVGHIRRGYRAVHKTGRDEAGRIEDIEIIPIQTGIAIADGRAAAIVGEVVEGDQSGGCGTCGKTQGGKKGCQRSSMDHHSLRLAYCA